MDLVELKAEFGKDMAFMGGIDVRNMNLEDPAPLEKEIQEKVTVAKKEGGFIYHSDHSIPNTISFQQYKHVIELIKKYGEYTS